MYINTEEQSMIKSKIMSYITQDFQSKSDLIVGGEEWQKVVLDMQSKFAKAGAIRQTVSQVFNKDGIQRLGNLWEYTDEKAFVDCQLLFREAEQKFNKTKYHRNYFQTEVLFYMMFISDSVSRIKFKKQTTSI